MEKPFNFELPPEWIWPLTKTVLILIAVASGYTLGKYYGELPIGILSSMAVVAVGIKVLHWEFREYLSFVN